MSYSLVTKTGVSVGLSSDSLGVSGGSISITNGEFGGMGWVLLLLPPVDEAVAVVPESEMSDLVESIDDGRWL